LHIIQVLWRCLNAVNNFNVNQLGVNALSLFFNFLETVCEGVQISRDGAVTSCVLFQPLSHLDFLQCLLLQLLIHRLQLTFDLL